MPRISPTVPQFEYITCKDKYPAMVAGFGAGKTEAAIKRSILGLLANPDVNRGFYEPTYDLVRMIAFPRFEEALTELGLPYRLYKSPLNYIEVAGIEGRIFFRSMDTPSRIIGYEHGDADVDELDTLKPDDAADVWRRILSRNRQTKKSGEPNTIGVTTTPEGFRFVYEAWKKNPRDGYRIIQAPTTSNPHLPDDYIPSLQAIYPEELLSAYISGEFVNLTSGTVYKNYSADGNRSKEIVKKGEPLFVGMDFNVTKMAAVIFVQRKGGREWHAVDEIKNGYDTPEVIEILRERYEGHEITVYPDASGKNRKTVGASTSDIAMLRGAGFNIKAKAANPLVKDRVLSVNSAFSRGVLFVNDSACPETAECLQQQVYDDNGQPDKKGGKDHQNDAFGYPIAYEFPVRKPTTNVNVRF